MEKLAKLREKIRKWYKEVDWDYWFLVLLTEAVIFLSCLIIMYFVAKEAKFCG